LLYLLFKYHTCWLYVDPINWEIKEKVWPPFDPISFESDTPKSTIWNRTELETLNVWQNPVKPTLKKLTRLQKKNSSLLRRHSCKYIIALYFHNIYKKIYHKIALWRCREVDYMADLEKVSCTVGRLGSALLSVLLHTLVIYGSRL
jgi:hypothetical protein